MGTLLNTRGSGGRINFRNPEPNALSPGGRVAVRGGMVWTPTGARRCDVGIEAGKIVELGDLTGSWSDVDVIDASGLEVLPGFIDVHVHIDDHIGAFALADDFPSATQLAVRTGITTLAGFATQGKDETLEATFDRYLDKAAGRSLCDFTFHLTPTLWPWDWAAVERLVRRGLTTFKLYTTYRSAGMFTSYEQIYEVMKRLVNMGGRLLLHCEDDDVLAKIDRSAIDTHRSFSHALMRPEDAEILAVSRVIELAKKTGCPVHIVHVSTAKGAALIAQARQGCKVTCETAPHYLVLNDQALQGDGGYRLLCTPPLRSESTRAKLQELALAGGIDFFATDHCAFSRKDKDSGRYDLRAAPFGIAGLGALVPLMFELLVKGNGKPLSELALRLSAHPARLLGLYPQKGAIAEGSDGDLVILDPDAAPRPIFATLADAYQPYDGLTTTLGMCHVLRRGEVVVRDGGLVPTNRPLGRCIFSN